MRQCSVPLQRHLGITSQVLLAAFHDGEKFGDTLEIPEGTEVGCIENVELGIRG
jgi:hypothetical protein